MDKSKVTRFLWPTVYMESGLEYATGCLYWHSDTYVRQYICANVNISGDVQLHSEHT